ncbi:hypothetical protein U1Q18_012745, partial [Sarracenia purpurea var. burkii]
EEKSGEAKSKARRSSGNRYLSSSLATTFATSARLIEGSDGKRRSEQRPEREDDEASEKREGTSEGGVEGLDWAVIQCGHCFWLPIGAAAQALKEEAQKKVREKDRHLLGHYLRVENCGKNSRRKGATVRRLRVS